MHLTKEISGGVIVGVELGRVMSGKNPQHICNARLELSVKDMNGLLSKIADIRGLVIYRKPDNEILIKAPGYKPKADAKYDTAYIIPSPEVAAVVYEAVQAVDPKEYVQYYGGPKIWSIWTSNKPKIERDEDVTDGMGPEDMD